MLGSSRKCEFIVAMFSNNVPVLHHASVSHIIHVSQAPVECATSASFAAPRAATPDRFSYPGRYFRLPHLEAREATAASQPRPPLGT